MASSTTEIPVPPASSKIKSSEALEAEAVGLEVAVRVHGSQITAVVLESTEHVEPFEEDTTTMIVFPRGGVVKLRARVRTGHALVLTNLQTKQTALCRIVQVNSPGSNSSYVKLEFIQPAPGFWGVHFPSDPPSVPAIRQATPAPESAAPPIAPKPAAPAAPVIPTPQRINTPVIASPVLSLASPPVRETSVVAQAKKDPVVALPPPMEYAPSKVGHQEELVPLANDQAVVEMKVGVPTKPLLAQAAPTKPPAPFAGSRSNGNAEAGRGSSGPSVFDTLSTEEEVFSREPEVTRPSSVNIRTSFDPSSILQPATARPQSRAFAITSVVLVVLGLTAGAGYYLRHHPLPFKHSQITNATSSAAQPTANQTPAQPTVVRTPTAATETPTGGSPAIKTMESASPARVSAPPQATITITPVHSGEKVINSDTNEASSNSTANIYAGDLTTHATITPRAAATLTAQPPEIGGAGTVAPGAGGLNSLVPGSAGSKLPVPASPPPAAPKPTPVQGGRATLPKLIHSVNPVYPQDAITAQIEGDVQIEAQIDANGKVTSAKVVRGPGLLRNAAIVAVRQWKYSPAMLDGKRVATQYTVTVSFRLHQ